MEPDQPQEEYQYRKQVLRLSQEVSTVLTPEQAAVITQALINSNLNEEQVMAITQALVTARTVQPWQNNHAVNLRLTVPIPGLKFYLVLLAGRERRSGQRNQLERHKHRLWTPLNILVMAITLGSFAFTIAMSIYLILKWSSPSGMVAPTSIPWLTNQADCQKTGRIWLHGECWDTEHSPDF
ncbi:MAG: hypothetical protein WAN66_15120 [Limnoraphis robusta]|uniref:hypothetical protein n=1 Tax=Limnoraphis robusta TaxID=1118279 RepID=UPI00066DAB73|nr:hypothetical protein [Limnoraphis robusta]